MVLSFELSYYERTLAQLTVEIRFFGGFLRKIVILKINFHFFKGYSTYYQIEIVKKAAAAEKAESVSDQPLHVPLHENNNYQKLGGFHEVGLPLGPTYKRYRLKCLTVF